MEDIHVSYVSGDHLYATTNDCAQNRKSTTSEHGERERGGYNGRASKCYVPESNEATPADCSIKNSDVKETYFQVPTSSTANNTYQSIIEAKLRFEGQATEEAYCKIDCLPAEGKSLYSIPKLERVLDTSKVTSDEQETYFQVTSAKIPDSHYQSLGKAPFNGSTSPKARFSQESPDFNPQSCRKSDAVIPLK